MDRTQLDASMTRLRMPDAGDRRLRQKVGEFVGLTFFGQLLRSVQNSSLKGEVGHGGRAEEVFTGQLYQELAQRAGSAQNTPLIDAVYRQLHHGDGERPGE